MVPMIAIEDVAASAHFRHLSTIVGIGVDLRYASAGNFVGRDLYGGLDCAYLHHEAALALERVVGWLATHRPDLQLLVLDALRPQRVQEQLWQALRGTPLQAYIAEPGRGSIHSFGMALDVTLIDSAGGELDMGTGFDDLSERSHPALELQLLARGALSDTHVAHRRLLRDAMNQAGWEGIHSEWWHFDYGDRDLVRRSYQRVR